MITTLSNVKETKKINKVEAAKKLEEQRERDIQLVSGVFRNLEHQGSLAPLRFRFKKYAQDIYGQYEFVDGQRYRIPRMVARHLNANVHYLKYSRLDQNIAGAPGGMQQGHVGTGSNECNMHAIEKIKRCEFLPLEFMDDDLGLDASKIIPVTQGMKG